MAEKSITEAVHAQTSSPASKLELWLPKLELWLPKYQVSGHFNVSRCQGESDYHTA